MRSTRRAIAQARFQQGPSKFLTCEFLFVSLYVWAISGSFTTAVAVFFGLAISCVMPILSLVIVIAFSGFWGFFFIQVGYEIGGVIGSIVIGGSGLLMAFGLHFDGLAGFQDSVI